MAKTLQSRSFAFPSRAAAEEFLIAANFEPLPVLVNGKVTMWRNRTYEAAVTRAPWGFQTTLYNLHK